MSGGLFGKTISVSNTPTRVGTIGSNLSYVLASLNLVNTADTDAVVSIAITSNSVVNPVDYINYDITLAPKNSLVRGCLLMNPGESVYITANSDSVVARLYGIEQNQ